MVEEERHLTLRKGWFDGQGTVFRQVRLRPARVRDELRALQDFRVYLRPGTFSHVLLARVMTRLGPLERVDPGLLERLDPEDLQLLEDAYREMNGYGNGDVSAPGAPRGAGAGSGLDGKRQGEAMGEEKGS